MRFGGGAICFAYVILKWRILQPATSFRKKTRATASAIMYTLNTIYAVRYGSFVTAAGFFGGLWARYQKKQEDKIASAQASAREQIKAIEARAREEIKEVREGAIIKTDKRRAAEQGF